MKRSPQRDDAAARRLRAKGNPGELDRIMQEECRRRAAKKLAATLLCPEFRFPTELSAEQCTSDALAVVHAAMVPEGAKVVDLTCGLAIDAFHLAAKASSVLAIDLDNRVAAAVEPNARALGLDNVKALNADCTQWLAECHERFDVAFIDPARRDDNGRRLFSLADCRPDVTELLPLISRVAQRLIVKMSPMLDISRVLSELPHTVRLHAIGTPTECKELVAEIEFGSRSEPEITAHTIGHPTLAFRRSECKAPALFTGTLEAGMILGEPWPAVMKADPRGLLPGLQLHPSTNLWVEVPEDFPGRRYEVTEVVPFSSSNLRNLARRGVSASVATRNFPLAADALRSRLKATENSRCRLMGTTVANGSRVLIFMRPL